MIELKTEKQKLERSIAKEGLDKANAINCCYFRTHSKCVADVDSTVNIGRTKRLQRVDECVEYLRLGILMKLSELRSCIIHCHSFWNSALQDKTESPRSVVEPLVVNPLTYDTVSGLGCSTGVRNRSLGRACRSVRTDRRCRRTRAHNAT
jgi:hypothetical protein